MAEAEIYPCAACGGPNRQGASHCEFCRAPLATLRCHHCFKMNVVQNEHCGNCGEVLGLIPSLVATEQRCPDCGIKMAGTPEGAPEHLECAQCQGQFVTHELLLRLLQRQERLARRGPVPRANPLSSQVKYLKCPVCETIMHRRNFGRTSGVIVDVCNHHGVWFQNSELEQVLNFVQAGGLGWEPRLHAALGGAGKTVPKDLTAQTPSVSQSPPQGLPPTPGDSEDNPAVDFAMAMLESTVELLELVGNAVLNTTKD